MCCERCLDMFVETLLTRWRARCVFFLGKFSSSLSFSQLSPFGLQWPHTLFSFLVACSGCAWRARHGVQPFPRLVRCEDLLQFEILVPSWFFASSSSTVLFVRTIVVWNQFGTMDFLAGCILTVNSIQLQRFSVRYRLFTSVCASLSENNKARQQGAVDV